METLRALPGLSVVDSAYSVNRVDMDSSYGGPLFIPEVGDSVTTSDYFTQYGVLSVFSGASVNSVADYSLDGGTIVGAGGLSVNAGGTFVDAGAIDVLGGGVLVITAGTFVEEAARTSLSTRAER